MLAFGAKAIRGVRATLPVRQRCERLTAPSVRERQPALAQRLFEEPQRFRPDAVGGEQFVAAEGGNLGEVVRSCS